MYTYLVDNGTGGYASFRDLKKALDYAKIRSAESAKPCSVYAPFRIVTATLTADVKECGGWQQ